MRTIDIELDRMKRDTRVRLIKTIEYHVEELKRAKEMLRRLDEPSS